MFRRALFPASFDPIHLGHRDLVVRATNLFDEIVVAAYDTPKKDLLFSIDERLELMRGALADLENVKVTRYSGLTVNFAREIGAQIILRGLRVFSDFEFEFRMAVANRRLAPDIEIVPLLSSEQYMYIASTTVREIAALGGDVSTFVTPNVEQALIARFGKISEDKQEVSSANHASLPEINQF